VRPSTVLLLLSGAAALLAEAVFLRRASLLLGSTAVGSTVAIAAYLGGLAVGGGASAALPPGRRTYAALEAAAAACLLASPVALAGVGAAPTSLRGPLAAAWIALPAALVGATWPVLVAREPRPQAVSDYAANTAGAVTGTLLGTFALLPWLGVRGTELAAAGLGLTAAALALAWPSPAATEGSAPVPAASAPRRALLVAAGLAFASTGLEVWWMRLSAVGLGSTVQTHGLVLATHLATVAAGARLGAAWPRDPDRAVAVGGWGFAVAALAGGLTWGQLPLLVARVYPILGPDAWWTASGALLLLAMGGAPAASAVAYAGLVRAGAPLPALSAASGAGAVAGAAAAGLWLVPTLEARGTLLALAGCAAAAAFAWRGEWRPLPLVVLLAALEPAWDARLYAVGLHLRISDFEDPSPREIRRFVEEGWDLLHYDQGTTGAVAVGRSRRSGNVWLSINGKVDASTGADMPTQTLSAELPLAWSADPRDVLVVGLASGVTAGTVLRDPRVQRLTIAEIEPAVVAAERFFRHVNGDPLSDPRTTLAVGDARALLASGAGPFDVIVSEPSNPWITGVSSLFTEEYWRIARGRLRPGGVMCQWIQTYGLGPDELRALLRTFRAVFPDAVAYESIEGADLLLVAGGDPALGAEAPLAPVLTAAELARVAGEGWRNTDDRPLVEWRAPAWLHHDTSTTNRALLHPDH
jgi:spermidine synthase